MIFKQKNSAQYKIKFFYNKFIDLGKLYLKIGDYEKAAIQLDPSKFSDDFSAQNLETLKKNVEGFLTIHKLHIKKQGINVI